MPSSTVTFNSGRRALPSRVKALLFRALAVLASLPVRTYVYTSQADATIARINILRVIHDERGVCGTSSSTVGTDLPLPGMPCLNYHYYTRLDNGPKGEGPDDLPRDSEFHCVAPDYAWRLMCTL